jgi:hypothetical protein
MYFSTLDVSQVSLFFNLYNFYWSVLEFVDSFFCHLESAIEPSCELFICSQIQNMHLVIFSNSYSLTENFYLLSYFPLIHFFCVCVCGTGVWTQDFALARQGLYWLSHASCLFALVILEIGSCFLPRRAWTAILLF